MGGITLTHKSTNRISGHLPGNSLTLSNPEAPAAAASKFTLTAQGLTCPESG